MEGQRCLFKWEYKSGYVEKNGGIMKVWQTYVSQNTEK